MTTFVTARPSIDTGSLEPGSLRADLLTAICHRQPVIVVDSPPGAGKSTLLVDTVAWLLVNTDLTMQVACPTRRGAHDIATRLVSKIGHFDPDDSESPAVILGVRNMPKIRGAAPADFDPGTRRHVVVRTVASCKMSNDHTDLMLFDEAYQTTFADFQIAADDTDQVVLVGDPGQIGPVITHDTGAWSTMVDAPFHRAPEVMARRNDAVVLRMGGSYRLGAATVQVIAPLYGFAFDSRRPMRFLNTDTRRQLPEVAYTQVELDPDDPHGLLVQVAQIAESFVGCTLVEHTGADETRTRPLGPEDVAVVVSRSYQEEGIRAILRSEDLHHITVGTADKLQGGQWHAVVALDAMTGAEVVSDHQLSLGRLCVMASRHMSHLTWVGDGTEIERLEGLVEEIEEARLGVKVRRAIQATAARDGGNASVA